MALVSTSNMHVLNAQLIAGTSPIEIRTVSTSSTTSSSSDDSDTSIGSIETMTDASSIDDSPIRAEPEPNHLTSYFKPAVDTRKHSPTHSQSTGGSSRPSLDTPRLPHRAPSHSKRAHEGLHHKRSIQRVLSPPPIRKVDAARSSTEMFGGLSKTLSPPPTKTTFLDAPRKSTAIIGIATPQTATFPEVPPIPEVPKEDPFGKELAHLEEVAQGFGQVVRSAEADADAIYLESHGLANFGASDYMWEIQSLIHAMFADEQPVILDLGGFF